MDPKKHPSLPPNYVSFLQLQQRWLQEQQRKHAQQTNQKTPTQENTNQDTNFAKTAPIHHRNQNDVSYPKPEEQPKRDDAVEVSAEQKIDELKNPKKKKKKKKKNRKKSELQENQKLAGASEDQNDKLEEGTGTEIKRNSEDQRLNPKVTVGKTSDLECNFVDLSLNGIRRGSGRFDQQTQWKWKQRDVNLVWVKKEDRIGNSITGTQSSDSRPCYSEVKEKERVGRFPPIVTRRQVQVLRREHEFDGERSKSGEENQGTGLVVKTRVYKKIPGQWKQK